MSRCSVPFWRSMMSAMPAVMRLNRMKFTIMPGELRTNPLGRLAGGGAGLDDLGRRGRVSERLRPRPAGPARPCSRSRPSCAPAGMLLVDQIASAAARDASSTVTCSPASERTSLAAVAAPLEPWVETIVRSAFSPRATAAL